jgi:hypothetical protein
MSDGFPEFSESFLKGQDLLYTQFNELNFYVEDTGQEYFYFHTLKKVFPNLAFEKIFPLGGKTNVLLAAEENKGDKTKVYIVDLDFDAILSSKKEKPNLFYLEKYSIENYLFEKSALYELIKEHKPKITDTQIESSFSYDSMLIQCQVGLSELACVFLTITYHELGIEYFKINPARDFTFTQHGIIKRGTHLTNYETQIDVALKNINKRYTLTGHVKKFRKHFNPTAEAIKNIPGKYILTLIKHRLEQKQLTTQMNLESFTVRLAKNSALQQLNYLRNEVMSYIE